MGSRTECNRLRTHTSLLRSLHRENRGYWSEAPCMVSFFSVSAYTGDCPGTGGSTGLDGVRGRHACLPVHCHLIDRTVWCTEPNIEEYLTREVHSRKVDGVTGTNADS